MNVHHREPFGASVWTDTAHIHVRKSIDYLPKFDCVKQGTVCTIDCLRREGAHSLIKLIVSSAARSSADSILPGGAFLREIVAELAINGYCIGWIRHLSHC